MEGRVEPKRSTSRSDRFTCVTRRTFVKESGTTVYGSQEAKKTKGNMYKPALKCRDQQWKSNGEKVSTQMSLWQLFLGRFCLS